jgi:hypothetical protein
MVAVTSIVKVPPSVRSCVMAFDRPGSSAHEVLLRERAP